MKHGTQTIIANRVGISYAYISQLISCKRRPSWLIAKKLSATTATTPDLWLEGTSEEIKQALNNVNIETNQEGDERVE